MIQTIIRVLLHSALRTIGIHITVSWIALSTPFAKADPRAVFLLPAHFMAGITTAGRTLQASSPNLVQSIVVEVLLVCFECAFTMPPIRFCRPLHQNENVSQCSSLIPPVRPATSLAPPFHPRNNK